MLPEYVPIITVMVRGLTNADSGIAFTKRLVYWLESEECFNEEDFSVTLEHAIHEDPVEDDSQPELPFGDEG